MAKRPPIGKCVHCLRDDVERNWDHVFPKSWYPDASPSDVYKWSVPSCIECNAALGRIEEDFLRRVGLCLDAFAPESASVVQTTLRSMRPSAGKSERDRRVRGGLRRKILAESLQGKDIPSSGVYPGMGERWGRKREDRTAILVPEKSFQRLTEKMVRGIVYLEDCRFIEPPYSVKFHVLPQAEGDTIRRLIDRFGVAYRREPGVVIRRAVAPEDGMSSMFEIEFWGQFKTYAFVTESEERSERRVG